MGRYDPQEAFAQISTGDICHCGRLKRYETCCMNRPHEERLSNGDALTLYERSRATVAAVRYFQHRLDRCRMALAAMPPVTGVSEVETLTTLEAQHGQEDRRGYIYRDVAGGYPHRCRQGCGPGPTSRPHSLRTKAEVRTIRARASAPSILRDHPLFDVKSGIFQDTM